jgi:hypothetical protein
MKPHLLTGPKPRIEDGLGNLPADVRWRLRHRFAGNCPDCGKPAPHDRVRCVRCTRARVDRTRSLRVMDLWVSGAPMHQIERLVIGRQPSPNGANRGNPEGLVLSCKCGRITRIHRANECCICGEDLWPRWVHATSRRRWIHASDAQRAEGLIG